NRGVAVEHVERFSGRRIARVQVTEARTPAEARRAHAEGRPVVYRPEAIAKVDTSYRERVDRRVVEAKTAEKERANRPATDPTTDKQAEHDRAVRRDSEKATTPPPTVGKSPKVEPEAQTAKQAEHERAVRRAEEAKAAEKGKGDPKDDKSGK